MAEIPFTEPADFQAVLINDLLGYHGDSAFLQRSCSRMWNVKITATYSGLSSDMRRARYCPGELHGSRRRGIIMRDSLFGSGILKYNPTGERVCDL
jgi:hypothetical protein